MTTTMWNVEGATVTDMAATGASPGYYDFESFQEIQVDDGRRRRLDSDRRASTSTW